MLNLFSYGDSDGEEETSKTPVKENIVPVEPKKQEKPEAKASNSLFAELPKVKKTKGKKQINFAEIAKFAQVPIEELKKEFRGDKEIVEEKKETKSDSSLFNMLPKPKNSEQVDTTEKIQITPEKEQDIEIQKEEDLPVKSSSGIQLNPFLDDAVTIQTEEKEPIPAFTTIYHVPQRKREYEEVAPSTTPIQEEPAPTFGYGYGSNYSQSQYEAYMRRSGMMATATAKTTASANMLGEDAQYYDKYTKQAIENGNVIELNQNDLHDHSAQPGSEYWERKKRKAAVAAQFGKYAHIAPTQVQQTRNQITYLASQAIEQLADIDNRRAQIRKTRKEVRSKYGW